MLGEALIMCGESRAGCKLLRKNCAMLETSDPLAGLHELLGTVGSGLIFTEEYALARRLLDRAVNSRRAASAPAVLPWLLACRSQLDFRTGRWRQAYAEAFEAAELAEETAQVGVSPYAFSSLGLMRPLRATRPTAGRIARESSVSCKAPALRRCRRSRAASWACSRSGWGGPRTPSTT
jgi:hypothetical protein